MPRHERNTDGIKRHARAKREETAQKVDRAIQRLLRAKDTVNFNTVSQEAGVSKSYLYTHPPIRERIERLRKKQQALPSPRQVKHEMTAASKDVIIAAKNRRIQELIEENQRLKKELQKLRGKLYDSA